MSEEQKPLPSVEYSLKSISWHLKTLNESLGKMRELMEVYCNKCMRDGMF